MAYLNSGQYAEGEAHKHLSEEEFANKAKRFLELGAGDILMAQSISEETFTHNPVAREIRGLVEWGLAQYAEAERAAAAEAPAVGYAALRLVS